MEKSLEAASLPLHHAVRLVQPWMARTISTRVTPRLPHLQREDSGIPEVPLIFWPTISSAEWPAMSSVLRQRFVANEESTRLACKQADTKDEQRARDRRQANIQVHVAAAIARRTSAVRQRSPPRPR